jgi:excisionase family DNA binding protein
MANPHLTELKPLAVTVPTARKISGLGNTTVWRLIAEKRLVTVRIGRRVLVTYDSLQNLLSPKAADGEGQ